jgi:GT2 family glycosyltransferase
MGDAATQGAGSGDRPRVAICIPSYRRPRRLFSLLGTLDSLAFTGPPPEVCVVVVDNDAMGSAREACEDARRFLRHPLHYVMEKRKGIPPARNAAVATATGLADWIAFIDDDEIPDPRWLDRLLALQRESGAAVVTGPVLPRFEAEPPAWVRAGGFFTSPRFPNGCPRPHAFTNNVLVATAALSGLAGLFDERFSYGVGEDNELFERLALSGHTIVWADDAVVHELIPAERVSVSWLAGRGFRTGTAATHVDRVRGRGIRRAIAHGGWCMVKGLARALVGPGRHVRIDGLRMLAFGVGRWAGIAGVV